MGVVADDDVLTVAEGSRWVNPDFSSLFDLSDLRDMFVDIIAPPSDEATNHSQREGPTQNFQDLLPAPSFVRNFRSNFLSNFLRWFQSAEFFRHHPSNLPSKMALKVRPTSHG